MSNTEGITMPLWRDRNETRRLQLTKYFTRFTSIHLSISRPSSYQSSPGNTHPEKTVSHWRRQRLPSQSNTSYLLGIDGIASITPAKFKRLLVRRERKKERKKVWSSRFVSRRCIYIYIYIYTYTYVHTYIRTSGISGDATRNDQGGTYSMVYT